MPRRPRGELRGEIHHLINRGNNRATVFHDDTDHRGFIASLKEAKIRIPVRLYSFTTLSNHFHAVVQPNDIDTLSRFVHAWMSGHAAKHNRRYDLPGHIWQGRFKSFPIEGDAHLLTVMKYVLLNPVRAGIVKDARDYPWSSLNHSELIDSSPVSIPDVGQWLSDPLDSTVLNAVRTSVNRQLPYGSPTWTQRTAATLGITKPPRRRGRPPKSGTGPDFSKNPP